MFRKLAVLLILFALALPVCARESTGPVAYHKSAVKTHKYKQHRVKKFKAKHRYTRQRARQRR